MTTQRHRDPDVAVAVFALGSMVLGIFISLFCVALYHAWAASVLWGWFMVPLGLPAIGVMWMYGIILFILMVAPNKRYGEKPNYDGQYWTMVIFHPMFALTVGWIVKQFM